MVDSKIMAWHLNKLKNSNSKNKKRVSRGDKILTEEKVKNELWNNDKNRIKPIKVLLNFASKPVTYSKQIQGTAHGTKSIRYIIFIIFPLHRATF